MAGRVNHSRRVQTRSVSPPADDGSGPQVAAVATAACACPARASGPAVRSDAGLDLGTTAAAVSPSAATWTTLLA